MSLSFSGGGRYALFRLTIGEQVENGGAGHGDAARNAVMTGPGAIVATIVFVQRAHHVQAYLAIAAGIVAVHLFVYLSLRFSVVITRIIREAGIVLLTRISGLLLSAIAVQLVADSVRAFVHQG